MNLTQALMEINRLKKENESLKLELSKLKGAIVNKKYPSKRFVFGSKHVEDIPHYIDGDRFKKEFNYALPTIIERIHAK